MSDLSLYNYEKNDIDLSNYNDLEKFKNNIFKHLNLYKSNIIFEKIIKQLSLDLNVSVESLINDFKKIKNTVSTKDTIDNNTSNDQIISDNRSKENKRFEHSKGKYYKSERKLILAAYQNKKSCLEIDSLLEYSFYDTINRGILSELVFYYQNNDTINKELFYNKLDEDQKLVLDSILDNETLPNSSEIKVLIKNLKEWPYVNAINRINNETTKTTEDLSKIIEYKKKITIIKKNKE